MINSSENLTEAQHELYVWIKDYMKNFQHSPSIRQMMQAMGLKSPAPIQSRLKHLQEKGYISWQEGKARTLQIVDEIFEGVPIMGSVAAGGLVETFADVSENIDFTEVLKRAQAIAVADVVLEIPISPSNNKSHFFGTELYPNCIALNVSLRFIAFSSKKSFVGFSRFIGITESLILDNLHN